MEYQTFTPRSMRERQGNLSSEQLAEQSPTREWADIIEHLEKLESRDFSELYRQYPEYPWYEDTLTEFPDIRKYAEQNSIDMAICTAALLDRGWMDALSPEERTKYAISAYKTFTATHSMYGRENVLEAIGNELEENLIVQDVLESNLEPMDAVTWEHRVLAGVYEELADITAKPEYLEKASTINTAIVESPDVPWYHGYKVHALMTKHDAKFLHEISSYDTEGMRQAQVEFYEDILRVASELHRSNQNIEHVETMAGSLFEVLCLGMMRDVLMKKGPSRVTKVRQAYLREDFMLPLADSETGKPLRVPNHSYDIVVFYGDSPDDFLQRLNIDLKKGRYRTNPRPLPGVLCVKGNFNGYNSQEFANHVINYANRQINVYNGAKVDREQHRAHKLQHEKVDVERLLNRHKHRST